jgi:hypothetical protein
MTGFDDRRDAMEKKYAHDDKTQFDIEARTAKLFGLWVAEKMGITGGEAESYAKEVVMANLDEPGYDDVMRKVRADLDARGEQVSDHILDVQLQKANVEARKQILES